MATRQELPTAGEEREALREKGQFWTPEWVAGAMTAWALGPETETVFDPAVGPGIFLRAAADIADERGYELTYRGCELYDDALDTAAGHGLSADILSGVEIRDFLLDPPRERFDAIVANPPYIRHHRIPPDAKQRLREFSAELIGKQLDARAGTHVYFLLRALTRLTAGGRLAFIVPADTCEGVFAEDLWSWISAHFRLTAVVTFAPDATPFPGVDTNPLILMIRADEPASELVWARCESSGEALESWVRSGLRVRSGEHVEAVRRDMSEALTIGLSRRPADPEKLDGPTLGDYASTMRGIATGANDYFLMTESDAENHGIPDAFLEPVVARTRDVEGDILTSQMLRDLDEAGRPTLLFSPDDRPMEEFPVPVQEYLLRGETLGLPERSLIGTRNPWYKMETRDPPPFLFAYLGRRNVRFIRNEARAVPLTGFLCVYPRATSGDLTDRLWSVLNAPATIENLRLVGKSYGGGAIKVEPRALEDLPLDLDQVQEAELPVAGPEQHELF